MDYTVVKQNRKTATIVISDNLEVLVKVPRYVTKRQIEAIVTKHEDWILQTLENKKQLIEAKDWYYTKRIMYLGKYWPVELIIQPSARQKVDFTQKGFIIVSDGSESESRQLMEQFYRKQAKEQLTKLAYRYAKLVGVQFQKITIRNQKTRWGSCSSKGNLSFNLKILCAPQEMMEYVVLHEVMHLKHFNHSKEFWKDIEVLMPDYKKRMNYFKQFGQNFMI
ncbi:MAG: M48 family metallopeptidase [Cellulosilyticum sp.]|nr:M48 family metallopeptidase [Cellulosilyticum sp.]